MEVTPVNAGTERLKVSRRPPVPNAESGPNVCIVFNVRVLLLVLLLLVVVDDPFGCFMAVTGAASDDPD